MSVSSGAIGLGRSGKGRYPAAASRRNLNEAAAPADAPSGVGEHGGPRLDGVRISRVVF